MPRSEKLKVLSRRNATDPSGYMLEAQPGFLLRLAMQRHTSIFMSRMINELTQTQFAAMAKLIEVGSCSQNYLGRLIYLDAATIKGVVDRLHLRGFVTILHDPKDRRRRAVGLTKKGRLVTEAAKVVAAEITAATLEPLSAGERGAITRLLRKLT